MQQRSAASNDNDGARFSARLEAENCIKNLITCASLLDDYDGDDDDDDDGWRPELEHFRPLGDGATQSLLNGFQCNVWMRLGGWGHDLHLNGATFQTILCE